jgi:surfactin synthase thioesterase subunit
MPDANHHRHRVGPHAGDPSLWFPAPKPNSNASLRLICFPYAGGGMAAFRAWRDAFTDTVELRVAQLPGRAARWREERFERMPPLIATLAEVIGPLLDRPFAFFGHSLGAVVAFEVARCLRERGVAPSHLFVSGNIAPDLPYPTAPIHQLPEDAFLAELRKLHGMPQAVLDSKELLDLMLPVVRSDFALLETYQYEPQAPLPCPITAFGGSEDPRTTQEGLERWRAQTVGPFHLVMLPGDHFFMDTARPLLVQSIARRLREESRALAGLEASL